MTLFTSKIRIVIAGIGGVGGYFGGQLARHYEKNKEAEIIFFARGENEKAIRQNGLKVESTIGEFIAKPKLVTSDASEIGKADFLIICTKSYDLEQTLLQLSPCINESTVILPLLNGIDNYERQKTVSQKTKCGKVVSTSFRGL
jgi:2-dehydropantoate 2-reductase